MKIRTIIGLAVLCALLVSCDLPGLETSSETESPATSPTNTIPSGVEAPTETPLADTTTPIPTVELPPIATATSFPGVWYMPQPGTPLATFNIVHETAGCSWLGVGGQVFGLDAVPVTGLTVLVGGTLDGYQVGGVGMTGMETSLGEGGYEITLADHPSDSTGTLWVQVLDENNAPLSDKIGFDTVNDCDRNFILINFIRSPMPFPSGNSWLIYLPVLLKQTSLALWNLP
jgi:hypothetical protein